MLKRCVVLGCAALMVGVSAVQADVRLPKVFSDHMMLQRDMAAPVWGWAEPGEAVTVQVAGQKVETKADPAGKWQIKLAPLKAGGPVELVVTGKNTITVTDVLVGDIWICAGQSNMEMAMRDADNGKAIAKASTNLAIRLLNVKPLQASVQATDIPNGWTICSPDTVSGFSAVGFYFGAKIHQETGIPIGLICNAWGGTPIEPWTNLEGLSMVPELAPMLKSFTNALAAYDSKLANLVDPVSQWVEKARAAQLKGERLPIPPSMPTNPVSTLVIWTSIYNSRVAPLVPFGIKGALWYQGEANGGEGDIYYNKMQALIGGWRQVWGQGDFPFYYVQLANWLAANDRPDGGADLGWARLRSAQLKSLQIPHTGMGLSLDIGDAANIHPVNKEDVGHRLAFWALKNDYGQTNLVCSGPLYKGMAVEGSKIRISFDYAEGGLMVGKKEGHGPAVQNLEGKLQRFAIAGDDKKWFWAEAVIEGTNVVVSCEAVQAPVAVRYAFSMNPAGCNLYNQAGLPASSFRTDSW